jgi:hypothetical protein
VRHAPAAHTGTCHCGAPATRHVAYGSGCGNVCGAHAAVIKTVKGGMYSEGGLVVLVPVDITGRMGRGHLMLPCKHQRVNFPDPYYCARQLTRICSVCRTRYAIEVILPPPGSEHEATAQITALN